MSEYIIKGETLSAMADEVRILAGTSGALAPSDMTASINNENNNFANNLSEQDSLIAQIQAALENKAAGGGVELPELNNEGTSSDLLSGKQLIDGDGNVVIGTYVDPFYTGAPFTYSINSVDGADYGFTLNDTGYYESQNKGVNYSYAICRVDLNVKSVCDITFDVVNYAESTYDYALFSNLDTALTLSYTADSSGIKENFKGKQSPSVVNVIYNDVSVGTHFIDIKFVKDQSTHSNYDSVQFKLQYDYPLHQTTIDKILEADVDLVPENIKSGIDIFGVIGTYVGDTSIEDKFVTRNVSGSYWNDRVDKVGNYAFAYCTNLTTASFPACTSVGTAAFSYCTRLSSVSFPACVSIGNYAFAGCASLTIANFPTCTFIGTDAFSYCTSLTTANFPVCTTIGTYVFANCYRLTTVSFPACKSIGARTFSYCTSLTTASFPACTIIDAYVFLDCYNLTSLYLTGSSLCTLTNSNAFSSTPIGGYSTSAGTYGTIYVPASLLASYQAATNWTYFSSRFSSI